MRNKMSSLSKKEKRAAEKEAMKKAKLEAKAIKKAEKEAMKKAKQEAKAIKKAKKIALKAYKQVAKIRAKTIKKAEKEAKKKAAKGKNRGEKGEKRVILELLLHKDNHNWLASYFGDESSQGIEVIDSAKNKTITSIEQIEKAASDIKADIKIKFNSTQRVIGVSIKYFHKSNPCIVNCTSRDKFIKNPNLKPLVPSMDTLVGQYLKDPSNVCQKISEVDRSLSCYTLTEIEKRNVAAVIAYFTLDGTGKKDASVPANGVLDMYHSTEQMTYKECSTEEEKIDYVVSNWNRYIISIRGVKQQKNGKLRGNGMSTKKNPTEDQMPWVCYYNDKGVMRPRGAISIRIKK